ncbi:hypothetical protein HLK59_38765 [Streptomyces sp. S3(2020)]|uniref:hypothetical protein n=1 Tax=Streptomyces sp. S3(2020) TaxID=2732044 RepID=UPI0014886ABC|nr:hypothetical protein [Streptomyces sp. S3(2020)]NNN36200.1 hypothetical protein [Streptomyces sp. S3(2020)]
MTHAASFRHQFRSDSFYELGIEVGSTDDAGLQAVLGAVWAAAEVEGCFGRGDREPEEQEAVPCTVASLEEFGRLHGRVRLPSAELVVCGVMAVRGGDDSSDWLDFSVPHGALAAVGVATGDGGPFYRSALIDDWPAAIGIEAFRRAPFSCAAVGWEVSGCVDAASLAGELSEKTGVGHLVPRDGVLHYGPAND